MLRIIAASTVELLYVGELIAVTTGFLTCFRVAVGIDSDTLLMAAVIATSVVSLTSENTLEIFASYLLFFVSMHEVNFYVPFLLPWTCWHFLLEL